MNQSKPSVDERITQYLSTGGLFNPELADHNAVRDLLIDARDAIRSLSVDATEAKYEIEHLRSLLKLKRVPHDQLPSQRAQPQAEDK
jgi:hypothetical protein